MTGDTSSTTHTGVVGDGAREDASGPSASAAGASPALRLAVPTELFRPPSMVDGILSENMLAKRPVRVGLSGINTLTAKAGAPLVSCLMLTANRAGMARVAIECFRRQTWPRRQLVIVDSGTDELQDWVNGLNDPSINYKRIPRDERSLGELRNLSAMRARGAYLCIWDDDDLHHPLRIEAQMTAIATTQAAACLLSRLLIWWPARGQVALTRNRAWEGSLICRRDAMPVYPRRDNHEDTPAVTLLMAAHRVIQIDAPELYVYITHGQNTSGNTHFQKLVAESKDNVISGAAYGETLVKWATAFPILSSLAALGAGGEAVARMAAGARGRMP
jgi:hypothetical protein